MRGVIEMIALWERKGRLKPECYSRVSMLEEEDDSGRRRKPGLDCPG